MSINSEKLQEVVNKMAKPLDFSTLEKESFEYAIILNLYESPKTEKDLIYNIITNSKFKNIENNLEKCIFSLKNKGFDIKTVSNNSDKKYILRKKWNIDPNYAKQFFNIVDNYIKKSAYKSDKYDPEDAINDIRFELWRALEKYGPNPFGKRFSDYTLKLKVNNILTNRYKKRNSCKSKLNYISESWDELNKSGENTKKSMKLLEAPNKDIYCIENEKINKNKLENNTRRRNSILIKDILIKIDLLSFSDKVNIFCKLLNEFIDNSSTDQLHKNFFIGWLKLNYPLYISSNDNEIAENKENTMIDLKNVKIGDKFITKYGKILEIRNKTELRNGEKTEFGFKVFVPAINEEVVVPNEYIQFEVRPLNDVKNEKLRISIKDIEDDNNNNNNKCLNDIKELHKNELIRKEVENTTQNNNNNNNNDKSCENSTKKTAASEKTPAALVLELLSKNPQSKEQLVNAIKNSNLSSSKNIEKYVPVIISILRKKYNFCIELNEKKEYILIKGNVEYKRKTALDLIEEQLRLCPQTKETLAEALINNNLTTHKDNIKKIKQSISVNLNYLKNKRNLKIISVEGGKYFIENA